MGRFSSKNYYNIKLSYIIMNNLKYDVAKLDKVSELLPVLSFRTIIKNKYLNYDMIKYIWLDFISKKYNLPINKVYNIVNITNDQLTLFGIENIFSTHVESKNEDLILFYQYNSDEVLYFLKSYQIINKNNISLPFHFISVPVDDNFKNKFDLKPGEIFINCL